MSGGEVNISELSLEQLGQIKQQHETVRPCRARAPICRARALTRELGVSQEVQDIGGRLQALDLVRNRYRGTKETLAAYQELPEGASSARRA